MPVEHFPSLRPTINHTVAVGTSHCTGRVFRADMHTYSYHLRNIEDWQTSDPGRLFQLGNMEDFHLMPANYSGQIKFQCGRGIRVIDIADPQAKQSRITCRSCFRSCKSLLMMGDQVRPETVGSLMLREATREAGVVVMLLICSDLVYQRNLASIVLLDKLHAPLNIDAQVTSMVYTTEH